MNPEEPVMSILRLTSPHPGCLNGLPKEVHARPGGSRPFSCPVGLLRAFRRRAMEIFHEEGRENAGEKTDRSNG